jgi:hypothetical protein
VDFNAAFIQHLLAFTRIHATSANTAVTVMKQKHYGSIALSSADGCARERRFP